MLQQGGLDPHSVLGTIRNRDRLDSVRDRRRMVERDRTIGESLGNVGVNRFQRFAGQSPAGTEPFHRLRPPTRVHPGAPNLAGDQIGQPPQPQLAGNVASMQLGQPSHLPELHPSQLRLQLTQLSKQPLIGSGNKRLDHMFDSTGQAQHDQSSTSRKPI
jgi:hypothetical protein